MEKYGMGTEAVRGGGPVPVPLWLPQVSPALTWDRTPTSVLRGRLRTAFILRCTHCTGNNVYNADVQLSSHFTTSTMLLHFIQFHKSHAE